MVHRKETLPIQAAWINPAANKVAAHVNLGNLVKHRCLITNLCVARTGTVERESFAAHIEIALAVYIKSSVDRFVRNIDLWSPCNSGVGRTVE